MAVQKLPAFPTGWIVAACCHALPFKAGFFIALPENNRSIAAGKAGDKRIVRKPDTPERFCQIFGLYDLCVNRKGWRTGFASKVQDKCGSIQ